MLRYETWKAAIPESIRPYWESIFTSYDNWGEEIFNYFNLIERSNYKLTNAYTECQNSLTRASIAVVAVIASMRYG